MKEFQNLYRFFFRENKKKYYHFEYLFKNSFSNFLRIFWNLLDVRRRLSEFFIIYVRIFPKQAFEQFFEFNDTLSETLRF